MGILDPFVFDIYSLCDGKKDLKNLSNVLGIDIQSVKILIDKLMKKGLIEKPENL